MKKYRQLTLRQRYQIWTGLRLGLKQKEIALEVGVHRSSISRELKRNQREDGYRPYFAMCKAYERRAQKGRRRIPEEAWAGIEAEIHQAIVTIVDRKSKLLRMKKIIRKTSTLVRQAICGELKGLTVHTLTSDNGTEFAEHKKIAKT